jgi:hypothetical protein
VPFTKTTTRALAASVALVAAGATVAGAAVFQLPILGFGRANVASATTTAARPKPALVVRKVKPKVVVKTRYVVDIVHRRAPARAANMQAAPVYASTASAPPPTAYVQAPAVTVAAPAPAAIAPPRTSSPTTAAWSEDGSDGVEHGGPPTAGHSTNTAPTQAPAADQ